MYWDPQYPLASAVVPGLLDNIGTSTVLLLLETSCMLIADICVMHMHGWSGVQHQLSTWLTAA